MSDICYRVCNRYGYTKYDSLDDLDAYLERKMAEGLSLCPVKRIVKVTSIEIPLTEVARKYNEQAKGEAK